MLLGGTTVDNGTIGYLLEKLTPFLFAIALLYVMCRSGHREDKR